MSTPNMRLIGHIRRGYINGFFNASLLFIWLHLLEQDSKANKSWFATAFLSFVYVIISYWDWREHKKDCDEISRRLNALDSNQDAVAP